MHTGALLTGSVQMYCIEKLQGHWVLSAWIQLSGSKNRVIANNHKYSVCNKPTVYVRRNILLFALADNGVFHCKACLFWSLNLIGKCTNIEYSTGTF